MTHMIAKLEEGVSASALCELLHWRAGGAQYTLRTVIMRSFLQKHSHMPVRTPGDWTLRIKGELEGGVMYRCRFGGPAIPLPAGSQSDDYACVHTQLSMYPWRRFRNNVSSVAFHGSALVASGTGGGEVMLFSVEHNLVLVGLCPGYSAVTALCFNANAPRNVSGERETSLAVGRVLPRPHNVGAHNHGLHHHVEVWKMGAQGADPTRSWGSELSNEVSRVTALEFSPDGMALMSSHCDGADEVRIWNAGTGGLLSTLSDRTGMNCACFSLDGLSILTGGDGAIVVWDVASGNQVSRRSCDDVLGGQGEDLRVSALAVSPVANKVVSGHETGRMQIWEHSNTKKRHRLQQLGQLRIHSRYTGAPNKFGHRGCFSNTLDTDMRDSYNCPVFAFKFDGSKLASGHASGKILVWDMLEHPPRLMNTFMRHRMKVVSVVFNPDGTLLASRSEDGTFKIWNLTGVVADGNIQEEFEEFGVVADGNIQEVFEEFEYDDSENSSWGPSDDNTDHVNEVSSDDEDDQHAN